MRRNRMAGLELCTETTVLQLVQSCPETEVVFNRYGDRLGVCICCEALFCSLKEVAQRYELNLDELLARLGSVIEQ